MSDKAPVQKAKAFESLLVRIRDGGLNFFLVLLILFPLVVAGRDFVVFLTQDTGWAPLLSFLDAGGQRPLSRSIIRALLIGGCSIGLILPLAMSAAGRRIPWSAVFILSGLLSVAGSQRVYAAESEWETWALLVLFAVLLRRAEVKSLAFTALASLYLVCTGLYLHALWIVLPATNYRLGGVFHHANALSTFTIFALPFLCRRAAGHGPDRYPAAFLAGAMLTLQLWAGSLTGACIVVGFLLSWLLREKPAPFRHGVSVAGMSLPIAFNLAGGAFFTVGFTALFLLLLALSLGRLDSSKFGPALLFLITLTVSSAIFTLLASESVSGVSAYERSNSVAARLHFYQAAGHLALENPLLGQGPAAFPREYPRYQGSVQFFSRFVHSIPLEILVEWGVLGLCLAALAFRRVWRVEDRSSGAFPWALAGFSIHCLSGVQTQFPYLLLLPALAWAVTRVPAEALGAERSSLDLPARLLLIPALLVLLSLNFGRIAAAFNHDLASKLYRSGEHRAQLLAHRLFVTSIESEPANGDYLLSLAQVKFKERELPAARALAEAAIATDPSWAAPRRIHLLAGPSPPVEAEVAAALKADPVNYPDFHRLHAEILYHRGDTGAALRLLLEKSQEYGPFELDRLPDFRAHDLEEQLVEFWLLAAILQEHEGRPRLAESYFRRALLHTRRLLPRYQGMVRLAGERGLKPGPVVGQLLDQVAQQLPAE